MTPQEFKDALEKTDFQDWDEATRLLGTAQRTARRAFDKTDPIKLSYAFEEIWGIYHYWYERHTNWRGTLQKQEDTAVGLDESVVHP